MGNAGNAGTRRLQRFSHENPIPQRGSWEDVSGDTFLRKLLQGDLTSQGHQGIDPMYDCTIPIAVDPASLAMRIMDVRALPPPPGVSSRVSLGRGLPG
jgi:hypothetical protein